MCLRQHDLAYSPAPLLACSPAREAARIPVARRHGRGFRWFAPADHLRASGQPTGCSELTKSIVARVPRRDQFMKSWKLLCSAFLVGAVLAATTTPSVGAPPVMRSKTKSVFIQNCKCEAFVELAPTCPPDECIAVLLPGGVVVDGVCRNKTPPVCGSQISGCSASLQFSLYGPGCPPDELTAAHCLAGCGASCNSPTVCVELHLYCGTCTQP